MFINRPNNIFRVNQNNYNISDIKTNKPDYPLDASNVNSQQKVSDGLIQSLKKWENSDKIETSNLTRWDLAKIPLKYYIAKGEHINGFLKEFETIIPACFLEWSRASFGQIRFLKVITEKEADIIINWAEFVVLGRDFESGHTNLKLIGNKIEKATVSIVVFPAIDKLTTGINRTERVKRTLLHEIGHSLGLKHSQGHKDIMHHRAINNNSLSDNDSKSLIELYKTPRVNNFKV